MSAQTVSNLFLIFWNCLKNYFTDKDSFRHNRLLFATKLAVLAL